MIATKRKKKLKRSRGNPMKKHACKKCKYLYEGAECPACKTTQPIQNWKGRIAIIDNKHSDIAKKIGAEQEGEYAIKVT